MNEKKTIVCFWTFSLKNTQDPTNHPHYQSWVLIYQLFAVPFFVIKKRLFLLNLSVSFVISQGWKSSLVEPNYVLIIRDYCKLPQIGGLESFIDWLAYGQTDWKLGNPNFKWHVKVEEIGKWQWETVISSISSLNS